MVRTIITRSAMAAMTSLLVLGAAGAVHAQDTKKETVLATVNGEDVTSSEMAFIEDEIGARLGKLPPEQKQQRMLSFLIDLKLVAEEAEKQGLDENDRFKKQMDFLRLRALQNEFFRSNIDEAITDEKLKEAYDAEIGSAPVRMQVKARHILLEDEDAAKDVIKELDEGKDFVELAKEKSTGPSATNGGDLGFFGQGQMVPPFEAAAFALEKGAYTKEPVKTQFGWHVILAEDKREQPKPSFDQVRDQLRTVLAQKMFAEKLAELKAKAKVEPVK
ncbi:peptidyl-prolyl cis-trans isomerase C [Cohaesibacter sp. ES.047]|uniref:peptidylprolyl isomerase n=1 Tax=Cohaesibacter sp. ES.047 TaxID=1798205 RepID=UPI000BB97F78|nr:peptidylprolyl isomerase [Cohaesibacter sp. ES.047]SNY92332.1 peptidyl-prolyl cis-trans isomerase C [Cohaesibacter sp. ES.047]